MAATLAFSFDDRIFSGLHEAARAAGDLALGYFRLGEATSAAVESKIGGSPVSEADVKANLLLQEMLSQLLPQAGWLSEESVDDPRRLGRSLVFVVDPIDGTRAFVAGDPRWTVSVALVEDGAPVLAALHAPALGETFSAARGRGAWRNEALIEVSRRATLEGGAVAGPKPMADRLRRRCGGFELTPKIPSLAYRIACVADGRLDLAFASADSHEWDLAAADLILREAGGALVQDNGERLTYNQPDLARGALTAGSPALLALALGQITQEGRHVR